MYRRDRDIRSARNSRRYWVRLVTLALVAVVTIPFLAVESNGQLRWFKGLKRQQTTANQRSTSRFSLFRKKNKTEPPILASKAPRAVVPAGRQASDQLGDKKPIASAAINRRARQPAVSQSQRTRGATTPRVEQARQAGNVEVAARQTRTILPPDHLNKTAFNRQVPSGVFRSSHLPFTQRIAADKRTGVVQQVAFQVNPNSAENQPTTLQGIPTPDVDFTRPAARPLQAIPRSQQFPAVPARVYPPVPAEMGNPPAVMLPPIVGGQRSIDIPFAQPRLLDRKYEGSVNMSIKDGRITLIAGEAPLSYLLSLIAQQTGLNIITTDESQTLVSVALTNVPLEDALNSIFSVTGYTWSRQHDIITVSSLSAPTTSPIAQGRVVKLFPLNFTASVDIEQVVNGLLSPVGKVFTTQTSTTDTRRTRETVIVEDIPEYVDRIASYIREIDQPPRQVMIEAHILQVDLSDTTEHGVNFQDLAKLAGTQVNISTTGFADPAASPALLIGIDGGEVDGLRLIEALKTTSDTKTLASPKILALNGQESRIQIGGQLGFLQTTTTETATLQNVTFLEVGVVLTVTPYISDDGRILMKVKPEVSSGRINVDTGLPEEETTEVETTVMLNDRQGMIIGGLIQEADEDDQSKVPWLGDAPIVGRLFQRRAATRARSEVIIALIPRIIPLDEEYQARHDLEYERATTRLLEGPLRRNPRPWEPRLPDACPQDNGVISEECDDPTFGTGGIGGSGELEYDFSSVKTRKPLLLPARTPLQRPYPKPDIDTATEQIASNDPFFGSSGPVTTIPNVAHTVGQSVGVVPAAFENTAAAIPIQNASAQQPVPRTKLKPPPIIPVPPEYSQPAYRIPVSPRRHR